jgi:hypothetical protein
MNRLSQLLFDGMEHVSGGRQYRRWLGRGTRAGEVMVIELGGNNDG